MSRAEQARYAAQAYKQGTALSEINDARKLGASLDVLKATDDDKALLAANGYTQPTCMLGDYQALNQTAGALIDKGLEPYLVNREELTFGMYPLIEVWDVQMELVKVGHRRDGRQDMVATVTKHGNALLSPDTLLVWR